MIRNIQQIIFIWIFAIHVPVVALTDGGGQPEFAGFTSTAPADLVNLYNGDFQYKIPAISVPGRGDNYSVALQYYSGGIPLEAEASWVGLGWNLKTGAISRSLNMYPDDYQAGRQRSEIKGNKTLVNNQLVISAPILAKFYYGSETGVGLSLDMGFGPSFDMNARDGFSTIQHSMSESTQRFWSMVSMVASQAISSPSSGFMAKYPGFKNVQNVASSIGQSYGRALNTVNTLEHFYKGYKTGKAQHFFNGYASHKNIPVSMSSRTSQDGMMRSSSKGFSIPFVSYSSQKSWIHMKEHNDLYGYMNLSNIKDSAAFKIENGHKRAKSRVEYSMVPGELEGGFSSILSSFQINSPLSSIKPAFPLTTQDGFSAGADGLNMSFRPFRQTIDTYWGQEPINAYIPSDDENISLKDIPFLGDAFRLVGYLGDLGGSLEELIYGCEMDDHVKLEKEKARKKAGALSNERYASISQENGIRQYLNSQFDTKPIVSFHQTGDLGGTYQPANYPEFDTSAVMSNGITNEAVLRELRITSSEKDFLNGDGVEPENRIASSSGIFPIFKSENDTFSAAIPKHAIVGYNVITKTGKIYEFHQPVFNYKTKNSSYETLNPEDEVAYHDKSSQKIDAINSYNTMERPYAYSWLLTAIKSPDYVDLSNDGLTDDDFGTWYRFSYDVRSGYHWRTPYMGAKLPGVSLKKKLNDINILAEGQSSQGYKDIAYLTKIESPTHYAEFKLSERLDGYEAPATETAIGATINKTQITANLDFVYLNKDDTVYLENGLQNVSIKCVVDSVDSTIQARADYSSLSDSAAMELIANNGVNIFRKYTFKSVDGQSFLPNINGLNVKDSNVYINNIKVPLAPTTVSSEEGDDYTTEYVYINHTNGVMLHKVNLASQSHEEIGTLVPNCFTVRLIPRKNYALQKLDRIDLYNNENDNPIKSVSFEYESNPDKELAPRVLNHKNFLTAIKGDLYTEDLPTENWGGKLTLRKIFFGKGEHFLNPYEFTYYKEGEEAPYEQSDFDNWGYYNSKGGLIDKDYNSGDGRVKVNHEVNPDDVVAWSLKGIKLPSGGSIGVEYENDSYSYVGRQRAIQAGNFIVNNDQKDKGKKFRVIGQEKSALNTTGDFEVTKLFTPNELENVDVADPTIRVTSVFRLYRPISGNENGETQINPVFQQIKEFREMAGSYDEEEVEIHLLALYQDPGYYKDEKTGEVTAIMTASHCGYHEFDDNSYLYAPVPIDLGVIDSSQLRLDLDNPDAADPNLWCQMGYVDFPLSKLKKQHLEYIQNNCMCHEDFHTNDIGEYYDFVWAIKRNTSKGDEEWVYKNVPIVNATRDIDMKDLAYEDPAKAGTYRGFGAWRILGERTAYKSKNEILPTDEDKAINLFEQIHWDYLSINQYREVEKSSPLIEGDGIIGGGLRVKRLVYNSGWNTSSNEPSKFNYKEYSYDCMGGDGGPFSSGATPSEPAPFNNLGDNRPQQTPDVDALRKAPSVAYRTVTEKVPGRGKRVYEFITSADVNDVFFKRWNVPLKAHYGLSLIKLSHLQGALWRSTQYSEENKIVAREENKYSLNVSQTMLNSIANISIHNASDALRLHEAVVAGKKSDQIGQGDVELNTIKHFAGPTLTPNEKEFSVHSLGSEQGTTIQRYSMMWYTGSAYASNCGSDKHYANDYKSIVQVEEETPRFSLYSAEKTQDGIGTKTTNVFYDFFSGEPLITKTEARVDKSLPVQTSIKVPAYWVYHDVTGHSGRKIGSIYQTDDWAHLFNNDAGYSLNTLPYNNNITATYSTSLYSELPEYGNSGDLSNWNISHWRPYLTGEHLVERSVVSWKNAVSNSDLFPENSQELSDVWFPHKEYSLRVPLRLVDKVVDNYNKKVLEADISEGESLLSPLTMPENLSSNAFYLNVNTNSKYNKWGLVAETENVYGIKNSKHYTPTAMSEAEITNAGYLASAVNTVDAVTANGRWSYLNTTTSNRHSRSGENSFEFSGKSSKVSTSLSEVFPEKYEISFWVRPAKKEKIQIKTSMGAISKLWEYDKESPQVWQRASITFSKNEVATLQNPDVEITSNSESTFYLDDIRIAPKDALIQTVTYNIDGQPSSISNEQDVITYFEYDDFGRLIETRDFQGLITATQSQQEAVR